MILVLGSSEDRVYPRLLATLEESGHPFEIVDEDHPSDYRVRSEHRGEVPTFHIEGDGLTGAAPVGSIFVRHAVARTLDPGHIRALGALQTELNRMLLSTTCPIVNPPSKAYSNYSKPYQVSLLAEAGFDVPHTLVTNIPDEARTFYEECGGEVIFKGISNVMTLAQALDASKLQLIDRLPNCPTLFQEFIRGTDVRVHVVGDAAFATRLISSNEDYRRTLIDDDVIVDVEAAELPVDVVSRCIGITRGLGLVVSGIDFKEQPDGRLVALELNPFPQFTFYEGRTGQPITRTIVRYLINHDSGHSNVFA